MAYASEADLTAMYGAASVAALADNGDQTQEEVIAAALDASSAIIDAHLGARYSVPITDAPPILRDLCIDIAWYRIASVNPLKQTTNMRTRYEDAILLLENIAAGKASVGLGQVGGVSGESSDQVGEPRVTHLKRY